MSTSAMRKQQSLSGFWRLCVAVCTPISLVVIAYYWVNIAPKWDRHTIYYVAERGYADIRDAKVIYNRYWLGDQPYGSLSAVVDVERKGYVPISMTGSTVYRSPDLSPEMHDKVATDFAKLHNSLQEARYREFIDSALPWLGFATLPFAVFWMCILVGRWVRAGFRT